MAAAAVPSVFAYDRMYRTDDEAYDALAQAQNALGFPLSKKRSKANPKTGIKNRIDVRCHKSGTYRPWKHNTNQYQTSSRKSDCPFYVIIRFDKNTEFFFFEVVSEAHNHEPVENPLDSCRSRRQSQLHFGLLRLEKIVEARSRIPGLTAKEIAEQIVIEYPEVAVTRHDVLCMQNKLRRSRTGAFATIQTFLDSLGESDKVFYYAAEKGPDDKVARIFWIYHTNIEDWKRSPEVLMFDNTYKINRLKMPLLQVTGSTPLHTNFSAGFGLTAKEDVASFTWILKQLKIAATKARIPLPMVVLTDFDDASLKKAAEDVFDTSDQQVCMWHILKNVTLNIQRKWAGNAEGSVIMSNRVPSPSPPPAGSPPFNRHGEDLINTPLELEIDQATERAIQVSWQALQAPPPPDVPLGGPRKFSETADGIRDAWVEVCRAESESEFWQRWAQLCYEFPIQKEIITYLHDTYVPERHQFAQYSVKWFRNFGIRMISRTKSSHLKDFFENTSTDLCQLEQHILEMVSSFRETYALCLQNELGRRQAHWDEFSVVKDIELNVGSKTMDQILRQVRYALDELQGKLSSPACTGQIRKQMGIPCCHQILTLLKTSGMLQLEHIDRHWWLKQSDKDSNSTDQLDGEFKLIQVNVCHPPPFAEQEALRLQAPPGSRAAGTVISRVQYLSVRNPASSSASPSIAPTIQASTLSRGQGSRGQNAAHRADGRVPVSAQIRIAAQVNPSSKKRRRIQRRIETLDQPEQQAQSEQVEGSREEPAGDEQEASESGPQQMTQQKDGVDEVAQTQPVLDERLIQEQHQQQIQQQQQQQQQHARSLTTQEIINPSPISALAVPQSQAPVQSVASTVSLNSQHHQSNVGRLAAQMDPPRPPPQPENSHAMRQPHASTMPSYLHHQAMPVQVVNHAMTQNSAPATYQQFSGMGNLNMYNLNNRVPQQSARNTFDNQNLQYTFQAWQPPHK